MNTSKYFITSSKEAAEDIVTYSEAKYVKYPVYTLMSLSE
jgi:hypothetical protein